MRAPVIRAPYPRPSLSNAAAGFIADESQDTDVLRTNWIREEMTQRRGDYLETSSLT